MYKAIKSNLVSILIPIYQDYEFLKDCLDSIFSQTHQNFELLIFDRCQTSQDKTIVKSYKDHRIKYFFGDLSVQQATIKLFSNAKGRYIKLFCADDVMLPSCLEDLLKALANSSAVAAFSNMFTMNHAGKFRQKDLLFSEAFSNRYKFIEYTALHRSPLLYPTAMIDASKIGADIFDKRFKQMFDVRAWLGMALSYQGEFAYVDKPLVAYRLRKKGGNISSTFARAAMNRVFYEYGKIIDFVVNNLTPENLFLVFPEVKTVLHKKAPSINKKYVSALVCIYFLNMIHHSIYGINVHKRYAVDTLFSLLNDQDISTFLLEYCEFDEETLKMHVNSCFEKEKLSYWNKCKVMFNHYLKKKGLLFTIRKTIFYFLR